MKWMINNMSFFRLPSIIIIAIFLIFKILVAPCQGYSSGNNPTQEDSSINNKQRARRGIDSNLCSNEDSYPAGNRFDCSIYFECSEDGYLAASHCPDNHWFDPGTKSCERLADIGNDLFEKCLLLQFNPRSANRKNFKKMAKDSQKVSITTLPQSKSPQKVIKSTLSVNWGKQETNTKSNDTTLPVNIRLNLPILKNNAILLNLTKQNHLTSHSPALITNTRGWIAQWNDTGSSMQYNVYTDVKNQASFVVSTIVKNGTNKVQYMGSFVYSMSRYSLQPDAGVGKRGNPGIAGSTLTILNLNGTDHYLAKDMLMNRNNITINNKGNKLESSSMAPLMTPLESKISRQAQSLSNKANLGIELFVVLDYSVFYRWYVQSSYTSYNDKMNDAIQNIRFFYTHIVTGINSRYSSINLPDMAFYVRIAGFFIATTPGDAPYTEGAGIKRSGTATDVYKALDAFRDWTQNQISAVPRTIPKFDSAALFTAYDMTVTNTVDSSTYTITGLAYIGATCTNYAVSINKDFGEYATIETSTHEIGHNLGAQHDGSGNACNFNDQYIMASAPGQLSNATFLNPYQFSSCSINYFRTYVNTITNNNVGNCLLNYATDVDPSNTANYLLTFLGQKYDVNMQCQLLFGQSSYYCAGGGARDNLICQQLYCFNPTQNQCTTKVEQRALDGTGCGNRMWCLNSQCVYDNRAQAATINGVSCIYGDFKTTFLYNNGQITCQYMTSNYPWACYESNYYDMCCKSCASIKNSQAVGCEFGDRSNTCPSIQAVSCYDPLNLTTCCKTCPTKALNLAVDNCKFGDRADWCSSNPNFVSANCYTSNTTCCKRCLSFYAGVQGCEYGDKVSGCTLQHCASPDLISSCCKTCQSFNNPPPQSPANTPRPTQNSPTCPTGDQANWCPSMHKSGCYSSASTCCVTCPRYYNAVNEGCEYGDKATWCQNYVKGASDCQSSDVANLCCMSCQQFIKSPNSPPSTCPGGDQVAYCNNMPSYNCYSYKDLCCKTCAPFYDSTATNCEYGDKVPWCATYVQGPSECARPEVRNYCCKTCKQYNRREVFLIGLDPPACKDQADFCDSIFHGFCYDSQTKSSCCSTCQKIASTAKVLTCLYGDLYTWCGPQHCNTNPKECCGSCASQNL